jgi:DNA-binding NtrC family response regulator
MTAEHASASQGGGWSGSTPSQDPARLGLETRGSMMVEVNRVLIVEDHAAVREMVVSGFEDELDFEIVGEATSLREARQLLGGVDVAILDLGLPDGFGAELIPELLEANPKAHALVLSATYDPAVATRAIEYGATAVLDKLTHLGQIAQTTRRILADGRLRATGRYPGHPASPGVAQLGTDSEPSRDRVRHAQS